MEVLRYGPITLDRLRHTALVNDRKRPHAEGVPAAGVLPAPPGGGCAPDHAAQKVWGMHFDPESNVVDVHVGNLRRKLRQAAGEQLVATVPGVGFSLRCAPRSKGVQA